MRRSTVAAIAIAISSILPGSARAQYGYPSGYGGYGWGGWGSTIGGSTAAGLGYFNMGRGAYNESTAVARSINNDTYLRWNQYMYQSQQHAANLYNQHLRAEHRRVDKARAAIQDRLRNHPEDRDITDGDALNVLADELLNPSAGHFHGLDQDADQGRADPANPVQSRVRRGDHLHRPDDDGRSSGRWPSGSTHSSPTARSCASR